MHKIYKVASLITSCNYLLIEKCIKENENQNVRPNTLLACMNIIALLWNYVLHNIVLQLYNLWQVRLTITSFSLFENIYFIWYSIVICLKDLEAHVYTSFQNLYLMNFGKLIVLIEPKNENKRQAIGRYSIVWNVVKRPERFGVLF